MNGKKLLLLTGSTRSRSSRPVPGRRGCLPSRCGKRGAVHRGGRGRCAGPGRGGLPAGCFHTRLKRRDIFALVSDRWSDPRARLLTGPTWETAKGPALGALQLPEDPQELLAGHAAVLDAAWRATAATLSDRDPAQPAPHRRGPVG